MKKLERMADLIYAYGGEWSGVVDGKRATPSKPTKSRRQTEIDCLIRERRQLKKQWRKATEEERVYILACDRFHKLATFPS